MYAQSFRSYSSSLPLAHGGTMLVRQVVSADRFLIFHTNEVRIILIDDESSD